MDELRDRIAADLRADPCVGGLVADARRLTDDHDAVVALVLLRLFQDRPCDDAARAVIGRAVLAIRLADAATSHREGGVRNGVLGGDADRLFRRRR